MTDLIVLPIVLPALIAAFLLLAVRHDLKRQRLISVVATAALLAIAIALYGLASDGAPRAYRLGDWPAPFGIVLVLDRLSATMLVLTAALALCVVLYAVSGWDERGRHFHPLFQFQLLGINGAFLTGDVFNLFVFFEVMLIASYGLLLHGGGPRRLRADPVRRREPACLDAVSVRRRPDLRGPRNAQHGRPRPQGAVRQPLRRGAVAHRGAAAVSRFRNQGGAGATALVAARDLRRRVGSGGRAVHDHDESRRVRDAAHLRHGVRGRRRAARRHRRAMDIAGRARDSRGRHDRHPGEPVAARLVAFAIVGRWACC